MHKILFVIDSPVKKPENLSGKIASVLAGESAGKNEILFITWNNNLAGLLDKKGYAVKTPEYYPESYRNVFENLGAGAGLLGNILGEIPRSTLLHNCVNLAIPYLNFFYSYRIVTNQNIAGTVINAEHPEKIIIFKGDSGSFLVSAFIQIAGDLKIKTRQIRLPSDLNKKFSGILKPLFYAFKNIIANAYFLLSSVFPLVPAVRAGKRIILLVTPSEAQFETFSNLIKILGGDKKTYLAVLCTSEKGYRKLRPAPGVQKIRYGSYAGIPAIIKTIFSLPAIMLQWKKFKAANQKNNNKKYFLNMISDEIPGDFLRYIFAKEIGAGIINKIRPDLIIVTEDPNPKLRGIQAEAKRQGIPVLCVPYGVPVGYEYEMYSDMVDYYIVSGELMKKSIEGCGVPGNKIKIAPVSRFKAEKTDTARNNILRRKYNVSEGKKIVLVTSNAYYGYEPGFEGPWTFNEYKKWLEAVYGIPDISGDIQLVVKPHHSPRDPMWLHREFNKNNSALIVTGRETTPELISICDVLITWLSTTAIEGILKDKPVISFNLTGRDWHLPFVKYGAALPVNDKDTLNTAINGILHGWPANNELASGRKKYIDGFFGHPLEKDDESIKRMIYGFMPGKNNV